MYKLRLKLSNIEIKKIIDDKHPIIQNFLMIGNDSTLEDLNYNRILNNIVTISVNRTWMIFMPDIMYIIDGVIFTEIKNKIDNKEIDYIDFKNTIIFYNFYLEDEHKELLDRLNSYPININRDNSIYAITKLLMKLYSKAKFYFYAMRLKYHKEKNHFWNKSEKILNNRTKEWEIEKLNASFLKFKNLYNKSTHEMISVMKDSQLNKILKVENIDKIYISKKKSIILLISPVNPVFNDFKLALKVKLIELNENIEVILANWRNKKLDSLIQKANILFVIQVGILKKLKKKYKLFQNKKLIIYNTESLELESNRYIIDILFKFKLKSIILDYSYKNYLHLKNININAKFFPFGYYHYFSSYKKKEKEKEIDFLFFGNLTKRRNNILNKLKDLKYNVVAVNNIFNKKKKSELINKSKICLDIFRTDNNSNNMHRLMELIGNKAFVISEKGNDIVMNLNLNNIVILSEYKNFVNTCVKFINDYDENNFIKFGDNSLKIFKRRFDLNKKLFQII
jgi:hypothetical protein